jgi:RNA polymerase sigma-70 factor, ECF subfamily
MERAMAHPIGGHTISGMTTSEVAADEAFGARLADRYVELLRIAVLMAGDRAEGEDAVQSALERAWQHRRQLREIERLDAWLGRIVVREVVRRQTGAWARLARRSHPITELTSSIAAPDVDADLALRLGEAFDHLPPLQRAVVVLHHYAGYPVADVAIAVGAPVETVRSRLRVAMARLRDEMQR